MATDKPKYYCDFCEYGTDNKSSFRSHIRTRKHLNNMAQKAEKTYQCYSCPLEFKDTTKWVEHMRECYKKTKINKKKENNVVCNINIGTDSITNEVIENSDYDSDESDFDENSVEDLKKLAVLLLLKNIQLKKEIKELTREID